ncbi:MAG: hypothetical protein HZC24_02285 [Rhodocyclales bacterium]|nr:hypothetical protein [Rhodocyclales bacterium]
MHRAFPELAAALSKMLDEIDAILKDGGYVGPPIKMFLAGGMAVNYWCGSRYTEDVDASFSRKLLPPRITIDYRQKDGTESFIYFDTNYNPSYALMHEDYEDDAVEWEGIENERRLVRLYVLAPIDLALSKMARLLDSDREDIMQLASLGLIESRSLKARAEYALAAYVGNTKTVKIAIDEICSDIAVMERHNSTLTGKQLP